MVTPLPRNKPTPIAPPMAIIVSCRWLSRRCKPSASSGGEVSGASAMPATVGGWSVIAGNTVRGNGHEMNVLLENFGRSIHVFECVIDVKRDPQPIEAFGRNDPILCQR